MAAIGIHLTKCAGTSLITSIRKYLTEDQYYVCSSFVTNIYAARPNLWDISEPKKLRFLFGHYIREEVFTILDYTKPWQFFLFTGVRDPIARSISQYGQITKVTGKEPTLDSFIQDYGSSMCLELMRAFPSMVRKGMPRWLNALRILTCFDYIYSTEDYTNTIPPVFSNAGVDLSKIDLSAKDNVAQNDVSSENLARLSDLLIDSEDLKFYEAIKNAIGIENAGIAIAQQNSLYCERENWFNYLLQNESISAEEDLFLYHTEMMTYELNLVGPEGKERLTNLIQKRASHLSTQLAYISTRAY